MAEYHGEHTVPADARFGIVVARFNAFITRRLLDGCREGLRGAGASDEAIDVAWVPGAFEIATVARQMALSERYDAVICIGCVIRGGTPHFEYVADTVREGVARAGYDSGRPVIFCVLTTDTVRQALERAGVRGDDGGGAADPKGAGEDLTDEMKAILAEDADAPENANKGVDAALAAVETLNLMRKLTA